MHYGIVRFPGSNCDQDVARSLHHLGYTCEYVWHQATDISGCDAIVLPGGFSYGDYLRCGAISRFSPVMETIISKANEGLPVIGICNGFQILCESGLLPGALIRNKGLKFLCKTVPVRVNNSVCKWLKVPAGTVINLPIAHNEGNYYCDGETLNLLRSNNQIVLQYSTPAGEVIKGETAPNGSIDEIAGICNKQGNVFGLMPHPERVCDGVNGSVEGAPFFTAIARYAAERR